MSAELPKHDDSPMILKPFYCLCSVSTARSIFSHNLYDHQLEFSAYMSTVYEHAWEGKENTTWYLNVCYGGPVSPMQKQTFICMIEGMLRAKLN